MAPGILARLDDRPTRGRNDDGEGGAAIEDLVAANVGLPRLCTFSRLLALLVPAVVSVAESSRQPHDLGFFLLLSTLPSLDFLVPPNPKK